MKEDTRMHFRNLQTRDTLVFEEKNRKISKRVFRDQGCSYHQVLVLPPLSLRCPHPNSRDLPADICCLDTPVINLPRKAPLQTQFTGSQAVLPSIRNGPNRVMLLRC